MFQQKKPYSAVTVTVENLTSESYEEDDLSGIIELIEVIKLQSTGPTEAARAIRKKLKYGNTHRQIRALVLLDGLIQNAGPRFQKAFLDEPLLERLRVCGTSDLSDPDVKKKCRELFREWAQYSKTPGLERIARLHKELPKKKQIVTQERSKVIRETEENPFEDDEEEEATAPPPSQAASSTQQKAKLKDALHPGSRPDIYSPPGAWTSFGSGSSKDKKKKDKSSKPKSKRKPFNLEAEKEQMKSTIADSSIASINLMNSLQSINRERERISENPMAVERFEACKQLRRRILRYIHNVESEQWLGSLLHANDELVHALMSFEQLDRSIDADSDSDDELAEQAHMYRMATQKGKDTVGESSPTRTTPPDLSGLSIGGAPPRPPAMITKIPAVPEPFQPRRPVPQATLHSDPEEDDDEDDPFADRNVVETPANEKGEPRF